MSMAKLWLLRHKFLLFVTLVSIVYAITTHTSILVTLALVGLIYAHNVKCEREERNLFWLTIPPLHILTCIILDRLAVLATVPYIADSLVYIAYGLVITALVFLVIMYKFGPYIAIVYFSLKGDAKFQRKIAECYKTGMYFQLSSLPILRAIRITILPKNAIMEAAFRDMATRIREYEAQQAPEANTPGH